MITIVGTSHVLNLKNELSDILSKLKPEIICIELDKYRYNMLNKFSTDYYKHTDIVVTIEYANKNHIQLYLIDKPGSGRFKNITKYFSPSEKVSISIKLILFTFFSFLFPYVINYYIDRKFIRYLNKYINNDKIEELSKKKNNIQLMKYLLTDREKYMVNKLSNLNIKFKNIVTIVGDRHIQGLSEILQKRKIEFKTLKLKDYIKMPITYKSLAKTNKITEILNTLTLFFLLCILITNFLFSNQLIILNFIVLFWIFFMLSIITEIINNKRIKSEISYTYVRRG